MIDLEEMRKQWSGAALGHPHPQVYALRDYTFAIEALCREVEEQRSLISELRRKVEELHNDYTKTDSGGPARKVMLEHYETLEKERDELRRELEMFNRGITAREHEIGRLKQLLFDEGWEPEDLEPADVRTTQNPTWLPAPDTKPPELADAQMVELRSRSKSPYGDAFAYQGYEPVQAKNGWWEWADEYRPLYSDSGLPLCSPEGLRSRVTYIATDATGEVRGFFAKPVALPSGVWGGEWVEAPESHRRPGDWRESLMVVMR